LVYIDIKTKCNVRKPKESETCLKRVNLNKTKDMRAVTLDTSEDRFIISIDKNSINKDALLQFLENLRLEALADKVDFGEEIEDLGEEIKEDWWQSNKDRFIPKSEQ